MSFASGIVTGLPGMIRAAQQGIAGSKLKWRTRRLALDWLHSTDWTMPERPDAMKAAFKRWPKWRVRLWLLEHGDEEMGRVVKKWRAKMGKRDRLGELIAERMEAE